jgi:hypothetical protein
LRTLDDDFKGKQQKYLLISRLVFYSRRHNKSNTYKITVGNFIVK